jgi:hypothetical protein
MTVLSFDRATATALVAIGDKQETLPARFYDDHMVVTGIGVRYPTGTKVWEGSFTYWFAKGSINGIRTPMVSRTGRLACHVYVTGFYSAVAESHQSKRVSR